MNTPTLTARLLHKGRHRRPSRRTLTVAWLLVGLVSLLPRSGS